MNNYKKQLYKNYRSTHNSLLYGTVTLELLRRDFPVNDFYFKKILPPNRSSVIVDLGCGDGNFVYYLQERGYKNSMGIDISADQIEYGKSLGIQQIHQCEIQSFLHEKSNGIDCAIARDVVEHLSKQELFDTLVLISQALRKDGIFILTTLNGQGLFHTSDYYGDFTHETPYTFKSLRQIFLNTGFTKVECFPINPYTGSFFGVIRAILWRLKVAETRFWKMVETGNPSGIFTSNLIAVGYK